jgi:RNA polymerase sigma-70 factor (ECF subfamily)
MPQRCSRAREGYSRHFWDNRGVTKSPAPHLSSGGPGRASTDQPALVRLAAAGDRSAMEALLVAAQETAYRFSLLVCGQPEDAEDVMQDALLRTYRHVRRIRRPEAFRTWLYSTVRNACLMKRRLRAGEPRRLVPLDGGGDAPADARGSRPLDVRDPWKGPDELAMDAWVGERLRAGLARLSPAHRAMLVLRDVEGLSTRDVARVTGLSEANVKTRLHRARLQLKRVLSEP